MNETQANKTTELNIQTRLPVSHRYNFNHVNYKCYFRESLHIMRWMTHKAYLQLAETIESAQ